MFVFFFKQMTAYEMRISDWSSDVCSSDLIDRPVPEHFGFDQVSVDNVGVMRDLVRELHLRGHRRILFIVRHKENIITVQRMQGLKDYVLNAGDGIEYFEIESGGDHDRFKSILARALDRYAPSVVIADRKSTRLNSRH